MRLELETVKQYARIDYNDDDDILAIMLEATLEELKERIPAFDEEKPTARQKILTMATVKDLYDNRDSRESSPKALRAAIHTMLIKETLR